MNLNLKQQEFQTYFAMLKKAHPGGDDPKYIEKAKLYEQQMCGNTRSSYPQFLVESRDEYGRRFDRVHVRHFFETIKRQAWNQGPPTIPDMQKDVATLEELLGDAAEFPWPWETVEPPETEPPANL